MKIVIDTNVFISSAILPLSASDQVIEWCLKNGRIYFSESTSLELSSRITRNKFDRYSPLEARQKYVQKILRSNQVCFCTPQETITSSADPDDNQFLEVAIECGADYLITGDKKHLLPLHPFRGIQIVQPHDFLVLSAEQPRT